MRSWRCYILLPVWLCFLSAAVPLEAKLVEIAIGVFVETADDRTLALLNRSFTDGATQDTSGDSTSVRYHVTPDVQHNRYDTYSLTSRVCQLVAHNTSVLFSLLPCDVIPDLSQIASHTSIPLLSWTRCFGYPRSDWLVSMTSPGITVQSVVRRIVLRQKWRRLVFIYDNLAEARIATGIIDQLRMYHVVMTHMTYSDLAFHKNSDIWRMEENYLIYCAPDATFNILEQSRVNRLDFLGPRYKWLLIDTGSLSDDIVLEHLIEGDNIAIIRPDTSSLDDLVGVGVERVREVLANLTDDNYNLSVSSCISGQPHNPFTALIQNITIPSAYSIWSYVQQADGGMGLSEVGGVTPRGRVHLTGSLYPQLTQGYNNRTFLVSTLQYEPFMMKKGGEWSGLLFDLLDELACSMNFSYIVQETEDQLFGKDMGNGSYNGVIGAVQRKEVDFAVGPITITEDRERVTDFTTPFWEDPYIILIRRPDPGESKTFICLGPFSTLLWAVIFLSVMLVSVVLWISLHYYPGPSCKQQTRGWSLLSLSSWQTFGALMQQGMVEQPAVTSARVVVSMWWFYVIVIAGVYNGNLIAFLTAPITQLPINSLSGLAHSDMVFGTLRDAALHGVLERATDGIYMDLWNKVKYNIDGLFPYDSNDGLDRVMTDKNYAYIVENSFYTMLHVKNTSLNESQCSFARPKEKFLSNMYGFAFQKGSPYTSAFSLQMLRILESGLIERIRRRYMTGTVRCTGLERFAAQTNIGLREAQGAFYILGIGLVAALFILMIENLSRSRCWAYRPGYIPPHWRERFDRRLQHRPHHRPTHQPSHRQDIVTRVGSMAPVSRATSQPMATIACYGHNVESETHHNVEGKTHHNVEGITPHVEDVKTRRAHHNGTVGNGVLHQAEVLIHADDVLSYVDIFTGQVKRSNLVYEQNEAPRQLESSTSRNVHPSSSDSDTDSEYVTRRRRLSSKAYTTSALMSKTDNLTRDRNDAETGEVIEPISYVSRL